MKVVPEKWLVVGHRGAGKTTFFEQQRNHFEHAIDLDSEIEKRGQTSILEFIGKYGEPAFRQLESATLAKILEEVSRSSSVMIVVGGGFSAHIWPRDYKCLWLRRDTDIFPRFFFNRPVLGTSDKDRFLTSFIEREGRFQKWADASWTFLEGEGVVDVSKSDLKSNDKWIFEDFNFEGAHLTLYPFIHKNPSDTVELRSKWNLTFELRTDLWKPEDIYKTLSANKESTFLVSIRDEVFTSICSASQLNHVKIDWDVNMGSRPKELNIEILSLHDFSDGLTQGLKRLENKNKKSGQDHLLKASPIISNFKELETLWNWWGEDPTHRNIHPRSRVILQTPMWQWFRLFMKGKQSINFVREASEGIKDQPTLRQWLPTLGKAKSFGAVLGDPVIHSFSPAFHAEFFKQRKSNFFAVPITKEDLNIGTFKFLERLGAVAFAVTSPLKRHPTLLGHSEPQNDQASLVTNTLFKTKTSWMRANTDFSALKMLSQKSIQWRIWGSGAVAQQFYDIVQNAELFSSSKNERLKWKGEVGMDAPLLWAAGDEASSPPDTFNPVKIYDLSYTDKSAARHFAIEKKIPYENGLEFFIEQAHAQQIIWKEFFN